jgi:predicted nuclease of predicted toxin-antitoxin system
MRFALDACVPVQLGAALQALGADVVSAAGRPAVPDEEVLREAAAGDRVLITKDKDFGELVFRDGHASAGIVLIRFDIVSPADAANTAARIAALKDAGRETFTVMDRDIVRTRPR